MTSDSPQVQCIQSYTSQEPDELSIEMADVLNLLERTDDGTLSSLVPLKSFWIFFWALDVFIVAQLGWMLGERLHDGERGWFPSRVVEEIQSKEVRTQNLKEAFRIQQAQGVVSGGAVPTGLRSGIRVGRRTHTKIFNFSQ